MTPEEIIEMAKQARLHRNQHNLASNPVQYRFTYDGTEEALIAFTKLVEEKLTEQEPVALQMDVIVVNLVREGINKHRARELAEHFIKHTTPPQRKPLTHEQRFDLLTKFEPHKNKWEAPAILIDMVEAAHGIKE